MVAREGLEPSKPLGRQIYSLLRLTASLPRQSCCCLESDTTMRTREAHRWSWRRDLNPRPADHPGPAGGVDAAENRAEVVRVFNAVEDHEKRRRRRRRDQLLHAERRV